MPKTAHLSSGINALVNRTVFLVTGIVHACHRHTVIVVKEASAQVHELRVTSADC